MAATGLSVKLSRNLQHELDI